MLMLLVEAYVGRTDAAAITATITRLQAATGDGPASLRSAIYLPDDETCFYLLQAIDAQTVALLLHAAGIDAQRTTQVLDWPTHCAQAGPAASPTLKEDR